MMCLLLPFYCCTICRVASAEPLSDFLHASGFISSLQARKLGRCSAATCERSCGPLNLPAVGRPRPGLLFLSSHLAAPLLTSRLSAESEPGCVSCRRTRLNRRCDRDLTPSCPGHASGKKKWNGFLKQRSLPLCVIFSALYFCVSFLTFSRVWMGWSLRLARPTGGSGVCLAPTLWPCRHKGAGPSTTRWDPTRRMQAKCPIGQCISASKLATFSKFWRDFGEY